MATLHLTLKKKWFDMIASGEKKEEYREIKQYWYNRLCQDVAYEDCEGYTNMRKYDQIIFKNGYSKDAPTITVECLDIEVKEGNPEWGAAPGVEYFVIKLGDILK